MKRKTLLLGVIAVVSVMLATTVLAKRPTPSADNGLTKGNSNVRHLYLYEKGGQVSVTDNECEGGGVPGIDCWYIVEDGAWGKMNFKDDSFVFNGHGLDAGVDYTLLRYLDPWETHVATCLGSGVANEGGNVHISGEMLEGGPKVWLVLSSDVDCETSTMTGWTGAEYLYEYNLI